MKNLLVLCMLGNVFLSSSCKIKNHYSVETLYKQITTNGDSSIASKQHSLVAANDSIAYLKALAAFHLEQPDQKKGIAIKFIVRNRKGIEVMQPGVYKTHEN